MANSDPFEAQTFFSHTICSIVFYRELKELKSETKKRIGFHCSHANSDVLCSRLSVHSSI